MQDFSLCLREKFMFYGEFLPFVRGGQERFVLWRALSGFLIDIDWIIIFKGRRL